jgi:L-ribulose-5-phosphate 3-epimerase
LRRVFSAKEPETEPQMTTMMKPTNRRQFLAGLSVAATATLNTRMAIAQSTIAAREWPIAIFEKVFEGLNYEELADAVAETGADGIEATIRNGGHIAPEAAADEVPKMSAALKARGKRILIAATSISRADEPLAEATLKLLRSQGITHYRMSHYKVKLGQPLLKQLREFAAQAKDLAALNREVGIQGLYQNHSGSSTKDGYVGALGWDAAMMLEGIDPKALGLALDTRHLCKDSGSSWHTALAVCKPHVRSIYVKDGTWQGVRGDEYKDVPLDTGFVNRGVFNAIRQGLEAMPLCIHMEWLGYRVFAKHEIPSAITAHQRDIATLRGWMAG